MGEEELIDGIELNLGGIYWLLTDESKKKTKILEVKVKLSKFLHQKLSLFDSLFNKNTKFDTVKI